MFFYIYAQKLVHMLQKPGELELQILGGGMTGKN